MNNGSNPFWQCFTFHCATDTYSHTHSHTCTHTHTHTWTGREGVIYVADNGEEMFTHTYGCIVRCCIAIDGISFAYIAHREKDNKYFCHVFQALTYEEVRLQPVFQALTYEEVRLQPVVRLPQYIVKLPLIDRPLLRGFFVPRLMDLRSNSGVAMDT